MTTVEVVLTAITAVATAVAAWAAFKSVQLTRRGDAERHLQTRRTQLQEMVVAMQEAAAARGTPQSLPPLARLRGFATGKNAKDFPNCASMAATDSFAADLPAKALAELEKAITEVEKKLAGAQ